MRRVRPSGATVLLLAAAVALSCSGRDRLPPEVPGVDLSRLTQEELDLYRTVLSTELSPCGGRITLEEDLRQQRCPLAPYAARFIAYRVEQDDTREELAERYLARYGAAERQEIPVGSSPVMGPEDALVTLVVFSDFQCPHCARAAGRLRALVESSDGAVRLVYRNFPLLQHRASMLAAVAGLAAARQGRFWELHDLMFQNRTRLSEEVILALAQQASLDLEQFRQDLLDPSLEAQVRAERAEGERLGVRGTPTIFINGRRFDEPIDRLDIAVEEEIVRARMNRAGSATSDSRSPASRDGDPASAAGHGG